MIPRRRGSRETVRLGRVVPGRPGSSRGLSRGLSRGHPGFVPLAEALWRGRAEPSAHSRSKAKAPPRCLAGGPGHSRRRPGPCSSPPPPGTPRPPLLGFAQSALPPAPSHGARERPSKNVCRGCHSSARDPLAPRRRPSPAPAVFRDVSWTPSFEPQRAWVMSCLGPSCRGGYEHCFPAHASVGCRTENRSLGNLL